MTTPPLNWREHMTEEEAREMVAIDNGIENARLRATYLTAQRETIRRRITSRVRWERVKAEREKGGLEVPDA